jgi:nuclear transport factor 2 (NTF2) superfamily protein
MIAYAILVYMYAYLKRSARVRSEYEYRRDGQWYCAHGNELWEFDAKGYVSVIGVHMLYIGVQTSSSVGVRFKYRYLRHGQWYQKRQRALGVCSPRLCECAPLVQRISSSVSFVPLCEVLERGEEAEWEGGV